MGFQRSLGNQKEITSEGIYMGILGIRGLIKSIFYLNYLIGDLGIAAMCLNTKPTTYAWE